MADAIHGLLDAADERGAVGAVLDVPRRENPARRGTEASADVSKYVSKHWCNCPLLFSDQ